MHAAGVNFQQATTLRVLHSVNLLRKWLFLSMLCLLATGGGTPAYARDCGSAPAPYSAGYSVDRNGDPDGSMTVTLERAGADAYRYSMDTRVKWGIFNAYIDEQSDLIFRDGIVMPVNFQLTQRVSIYKRHELAEFDWVAMKATGEKKRDDFELDIVPGMQDKLSVYLLLAGSVCRGAYDIDAVVVSGPELKSYDYRFQAVETLDTLLGRVETVHIRRGGPDDEKQTDLWHAEAAHFLPVKMVYRDGDVVTDMRLIEISFPNE